MYQTSRQVRGLTLNTVFEDEPCKVSKVDRFARPASIATPISSVSSVSISSYYQGSLGDTSETESEVSSHLSRSQSRRQRRAPSLHVLSPRHWPTVEKHNQKTAAMPVTPSNRIPLSPEALRSLEFNSVQSNPPSLDGSSLSERQYGSSIPSTPRLASEAGWSQVDSRPVSIVHEQAGPTVEITVAADVQLPAEAMNMLNRLTIENGDESEVESVNGSEVEMRQVNQPQRSLGFDIARPDSRNSNYSLSELSVPSPGGFFSSLDANCRDTWSVSSASKAGEESLPTSTVAEQFYNMPWEESKPKETAASRKFHGAPINVVKPVAPVNPSLYSASIAPSSATMRPQETPRTALLVSPPRSAMLVSPRRPESGFTSAPVIEEDAKHSIGSLLELDGKIEDAKRNKLDRISSWAATQSQWVKEEDESEADETESVTSPAGKSSVRFSEHSAVSSRTTASKASKASKKSTPGAIDTDKANNAESNPLFYQAFQHLSNNSSPTDSFVHRQERFDCLQALRTSLAVQHVDTILGNYQVGQNERPASQRPMSMFPEPEAEDEEVAYREALAQAAREREAMHQVEPSMWIQEAMRYLAGGRLVNSTVDEVLDNAPNPERASPSQRVRALDLGGQPSCDWAWHCAFEFPNVHTYTATSDPRCSDPATQPKLRGPSNHRVVAVDNLYTLPFPDNYFDVISARNLHAFLRASQQHSEPQQQRDEYDRCLRECMRCLKPGGYLEFFLLDAELVNPGPLAQAKGVEFAFQLRQRGYDAQSTRSWLGRVRRAGFVDIKRAWTFLPMGAVPERADAPHHPSAASSAASFPAAPSPPQSPEEEAATPAKEAVRGPVGGTDDAACISGLVGSCMWEKWALKLQMEMGKQRRESGSLVEAVGKMVEEGRRSDAGFRSLSGWCRKAF